MFSFSWDTADKRLVTLSALAGVVLAASVTWRVQRWIRHAFLSEAREANSSVANNAISKHVTTGQSEAPSVSAGKRHSSSHHEHRHHHKNAKSLSPGGHDHSHDERKGTEQRKHPRAESQPLHSGSTQLRHDHHESREDSSRILPFRDAQDEPSSMYNARHDSDLETTKKKHSYSGLSGSRNLSHQSHDRSSTPLSQNHTEHISAEKFLECLQKCIDDYFAQHPEARTYWEDDIRHVGGFMPPKPTDLPGKHHRDLALREAKLRKEAFENSKRAYKMGRKADARQLSDEGKLHDENAKRYNAFAAQEIFAFYNPRYGSDRLSKCDLHGLHVEEAMGYAKNHLISCQRTGVDKTMLIVGKGAHSHQGGARIKPAIIAMLSETGGVVAGVHEKNEGCIVVEFAVYRR